MKTIRNIAMAAMLASLLATSFAFAQGPIYKLVRFDINVPYELRMSNYILPEGHYVIRQMSANDINLFALYKDDMTHPPIAIFRTVRIPYNTMADTPRHTELLIRDDESGGVPVVRGFTIPGDDGYQIVSVVPRKHSILVRAY